MTTQAVRSSARAHRRGLEWTATTGTPRTDILNEHRLTRSAKKLGETSHVVRLQVSTHKLNGGGLRDGVNRPYFASDKMQAQLNQCQLAEPLETENSATTPVPFHSDRTCETDAQMLLENRRKAGPRQGRQRFRRCGCCCIPVCDSVLPCVAPARDCGDQFPPQGSIATSVEDVVPAPCCVAAQPNCLA